MRDDAQHSGRAAERADQIGRRVAEAAAHHRIDRPGDGAAERRQVADDIVRIERDRAVGLLQHQQDRAAKAERAAGRCVQCKRSPGNNADSSTISSGHRKQIRLASTGGA